MTTVTIEERFGISQIEDRFSSFARELQGNIEQTSSWPPEAAADFCELTEVLTKVDTIKDLQDKAKVLSQVSDLTLQFLDKYRELLPTKLCQELKYNVAMTDGVVKMLRGLHFASEGESTADDFKKLEKLAMGADLVAQAVEDHPKEVLSEKYNIIKRLAQSWLQQEAEIVFPQATDDKAPFKNYKKTLRRAASSITLIMEQYEKEEQLQEERNLRYPKYGKNPEEQLEKNKPAMAWVRSRLDRKRSKQEIEQGKKDFELLKEIIDEGRPEGHKIFS